MLDVTQLLCDALVDRLTRGFSAAFNRQHKDYQALIGEAARRTLLTIARSDTLYHNVEHTAYVTAVGQTILEGKVIADGDVTPQDWLNVILALLCHDIGYVRGILAADRDGLIATGKGHEQVMLEPGSSDAALMPYHVDRAKRYVAEVYGNRPGVDTDIIQRSIERTRFPIPSGSVYQRTGDFAGLVRGADLIGQLSDPRYLRKLPAVFFEFEEVGFNETTGYKRPGDLITSYADFYRGVVEPYVQESLGYLSQTEEGKQVISSLYANVSIAEQQMLSRPSPRHQDTPPQQRKRLRR